MKKKQFKSESKRLLDLMIHSIYTNKDIFLRELISNASDALDKLYYASLTDKKLKVKKDKLEIFIELNKEKRTIKVIDNGCGMNKEELENNLGTIAKSGTLAFKEMMNTDKAKNKDIDIIGQFGVGFYSAFMVSKKIEVTSKKDDEEANTWISDGVDGYTIKKSDKEKRGTEITLYLKDDSEEENFSEYLEEFKINELIKKYSDYISYPIKMEVLTRSLKEGSKEDYEEKREVTTLNSMVPIWKRPKSEVTDEEYNDFYKDKYYDFENPLKTITTSVEGMTSYKAILFIPSKAPYDFYTKEYEKGLSLYSNGVMIMDKCKELLPDYFSFVKGVVDTEDLSLNISREMLQQTKTVQVIAKNIESKINKELLKMQEEAKDEYIKFFETFGTGIKFGVYSDYGMNKDKLKDLLMFYSAKNKKLITLKEYVESMKEGQEAIYYASGATTDKIDKLPQVEQVKEKDYDILYLTDYVDEFCLNTLMEYDSKKFENVSNGKLNLESDEEKDKTKKLNDDNKDLLEYLKDNLDVSEVRFTNILKSHPVCFTSKGDISIEMEKVINAMPTDETIKSEKILEINANHKIADKLKKLYKEDKDELLKYAKILYSEACLIEGLPVEDPTELSNLICEVMTK